MFAQLTGLASSTMGAGGGGGLPGMGASSSAMSNAGSNKTGDFHFAPKANANNNVMFAALGVLGIALIVSLSKSRKR